MNEMTINNTSENGFVYVLFAIVSRRDAAVVEHTRYGLPATGFLRNLGSFYVS